MAEQIRKSLNTDKELKIEAESKSESRPMKRNWEIERQRDAKLVRGRFEYHESHGAEFFFSYHAYKGDPAKDYVLKDGEVYSLPYGVAKHLNNIGYPVHKYELDAEGKNTMKVGKFNKRCSFVPLDFMPEDDFGSAPRLYTAEPVGVIKL